MGLIYLIMLGFLWYHEGREAALRHFGWCVLSGIVFGIIIIVFGIQRDAAFVLSNLIFGAFIAHAFLHCVFHGYIGWK